MSSARTSARSIGPARAIGVAHALLAAVLLCFPHRVAGSVAGRSGAQPPRWLVRVLGIRVAAQAALELARPTPEALMASSLVDGLHAASMAPVLISRRYRRSALLSGGLATASAAGIMLAGRHAELAERG